MSDAIALPISPGQCRAGRALLGASVDQLAEAAGLSARSVVGFEGGGRSLNRASLTRIADGLRRLGVGLVAPSAENGAGVFAIEPAGAANIIDRRVLPRTSEIGFVAAFAGRRITGRVTFDALGTPPTAEALDAFDAAWPKVQSVFAQKVASGAVDGRGAVVVSAADLAAADGGWAEVAR